MSKRSKKRRKPKSKRQTHSGSAPQKAPKIEAEPSSTELPTAEVAALPSDENQVVRPVSSPAESDLNDDLELDTEGFDLTDPWDTRLEDFDVTPRSADLERDYQREDEKASRIHLEELAPSVEIPPQQEDEKDGGLVDFLETPTVPRARRVQFLPEDHIAEPRYLPDDLEEAQGATNTSVEHSEVWGKQEVDTPSFNKFDEGEAIKEDLRAVPMVGKTIVSEHLTVHRRRWKWTGIAGMIGLFGLGVYATHVGIRHSQKSGSSPTPRASLGLYEPAAINSIDELLDRYFNAETIDARLPYIRAAQHVRPLMEAHEKVYGRQTHTGYTRDTVKAPAPYLDTAFFTVDVVLEPSFEKRRLVIERSAEDTYLLDWENLVGYQEMSWEAFMEARPTEPTTFRAVILPSDYYNFQFSNPREWSSWQIRHPAAPELTLFGYTRHDSDTTKQFLRDTSTRLSAPDKGTAVTVELAYPDAVDAPESTQVEIVRVVKRGWITNYDARGN